MSKVSIGLRGWRFDEREVFDEEGNFRSLSEMSPDTRDRIGRLMEVVNNPCDACWLIEEDEQNCRTASVVYGEPLREVVLCNQHELDFLYWFREEDGRDLIGEDVFSNAFRQWFADGGRAPEGYAGLEHVDTDPDTIPEPKSAEEMPSIEEEIAALSDEERESLDIDLDAIDR
jgi:hypothetical protein